jgi:hypothetical protein
MGFDMPVKKSIMKPRGKRMARSAVKDTTSVGLKPRKVKRASSQMEINEPAPEASFKLCLKSLADGEMVKMCTSVKEAAAEAWAWARRHDLSLVSADWDVRHPSYGWQDAYNVMITTEKFNGDDDELCRFFSKFFAESMSSAGKFEAKGEGTSSFSYNGIACYSTIRAQPFWPR